ncbi:MAG: peptidoglycan DD-metalloendopeptidase family protein [Oscillospiraceae bacterium]|nr:peptidoglycan DD-metalloendopeptidase family protein [Oscillospiraceae bacterium]
MNINGWTRRSKFKRSIAVALTGVIALSFTGGFGNGVRADLQDEIAQLESRQQQLSSERRELERQLAEYEQGAKESAEYLVLYDEKMKKQEEEILNLKDQISILDTRIADTRVLIDEKTEEIDRGIVEFKERLRVMYMDGSDSIASIIVGSTDFYDVLMRTELMERVSRHDKEMIDDLNVKINELNAEKAELEQTMTSLEQKRSEAENVLADLRETYNEHAEMKAYYEQQAEASRSKTDEMRQQEAEVEDELVVFIRQQQEENEKRRQEEEKIRREEERKRKAEEERQRKEEEERRQKEEEERRRREEEERKADEEKAAAEERIRKAAEEIEAMRHVEEPEEEEKPAETAAETVEPEPVKDDGPETTGDTSAAEPEPLIDDGPAPLQDDGPEMSSDTDEDSDDEGSDVFTSSSTSSDVSMIWPCPTVLNMTDGYGYRTVNEEGGASDFHKGIDITKPGCEGEKIVAAASGTVITASDTGNGYGIHVVIDHGGKLATLYAHMSDCSVSVGDHVEQGQTIGYIGSTGYAYGNHCHFEVRVNGEHTNPLNYVSM